MLPAFLEPTVSLAFEDALADGFARVPLQERIVLRAPCRGRLRLVDVIPAVSLHVALHPETGFSVNITVPHDPELWDPHLEVGEKRVDLPPGTVLVSLIKDHVEKDEILGWRLPSQG